MGPEEEEEEPPTLSVNEGYIFFQFNNHKSHKNEVITKERTQSPPFHIQCSFSTL